MVMKRMNTTTLLNARVLTGLLFLALALPALAAPQKITREQREFFESKIRAIFVDNCYDCHGAGQAKGDLSLEGPQSMRQGGSSGNPAVVPGDPNKGELIKRVKSALDPMPPNGPQLTEAQIGDLETWIRMGAPDPRGGSGKVIKAANMNELAKTHWAFQPIDKPDLPGKESFFDGKLGGFVKNEIDHFVLSRLDQKKLFPSRPSDRWTLIRRAYFDLTGLPPTWEEVRAFQQDESPNAYEKVIDKLLASPQYGERWGRYWLDVARYADTSGNQNRRGRRNDFLYAYTYRDYVIKAFNDDKPYDKFIVEQLAADRVAKDDPHTMAALGFLTLGRKDKPTEEIIDDQIDVVTRGFLGLSVYCARCHNHKFDPVPTADYYSLYGVFNSSFEPPEKDRPVIMGTGADLDAQSPEYKEFFGRLKELEYDREQFRLKKTLEYENNVRTNAFRYMLWAKTFTDEKKDIRRERGLFERRTRKFKMNADIGEQWQRFIRSRRDTDPVWAYWVEYAKLPTNQFRAQAPRTFNSINQRIRTKKLKPNPAVAAWFSKPPANLTEVAMNYNRLFLDVDALWGAALNTYGAWARTQPDKEKAKSMKPKNFADAQKRLNLQMGQRNLTAYEKLLTELNRNAPFRYPWDRLRRFRGGRLENEEFNKFVQKMENLKMTHEGSPPRAMVLLDKGNPQNERIMIKGNARQRGDAAPRQFLKILSPEDRQPYKNGSGRLELAQDIASKDNPLTARVIANRIWMLHFGSGLSVAEANEFGLRAEAPTHPKLLDYLAWYLMENGWSLKKLHKLIMLSATYQQSSDVNVRYAIKDPDNQFLFKMNRRRLDFEAFRDNLIAVSGRLDPLLGGKPVRITGETPSYRRTIYGYIDRRNLSDVFKTFDFANPDSTVGARSESTVAQQSLFLMNSPIVNDLAKKLVEQDIFKNLQTDRQRVRQLYNAIFQREPEPIEIKLGQRFIENELGLKSTATTTSYGASGSMGHTLAWQHGYYGYDVNLKRQRFYPFPYKDGKVRQGGPQRPHKVFGQMHLTATTGHPGPTLTTPVIRRWTAARDTTVMLEGRVEHFIEEKMMAQYERYSPAFKKQVDAAWDGVSAIIVHNSKNPPLWKRDVRRGRANYNLGPIAVRKGDVVDFAINCKKIAGQDYFRWNPVVKVTGGAVKAEMAKDDTFRVNEWTAGEEFEGQPYKPKPLSAWEKYAQVLLLTNEMAFVD